MLLNFLLLCFPFSFAGRIDYQVIEVITKPSTDCFTQGLLYHQGYLYESCGEYGRSSIRKVDPDHGTILQEMKIPVELFGEGLTAVNNRLYLLTWNEKIMLVLDVETLAITKRYRLPHHHLSPFLYTHIKHTFSPNPIITPATKHSLGKDGV